jgi:AraC family transcriptional regulator, 4-hydroxyphenylacetate 3-monooxygenase operon regulatory protein
MVGSHSADVVSPGGSTATFAPIYKERGRVYRADTCVQLPRAADKGQVRVEALVRGRYYGRQLPKDALIGLCSVGFWDAKKNEGWGEDWQRNEGIEVAFLETGNSVADVDNQSFQFRPGNLLITRPWQLHRVGGLPPAASRLHWLIVDVGVRRPNQAWKWPAWLTMTAADRRKLTDMLRHNEQAVWLATPEIRKCFQRIGQAVETDQGGSKISRLTVHINELFVLLLEMFCESGIVLDESLSSARRTVELFLADLPQSFESLGQSWTVRSMARRCGLGVTHFTRLCHEITNLTPAQHLHNCRLAAAAKLLTERPEMNVTQIALACGFSSGQYLASVFRRQYGCSPQAFRRGAGS